MESSKILQEILERENENPNSLSKKMGISRAQPLYDILSGKIKYISREYAEKIIEIYPKYTKSWIILGEGNMLKQDDSDANPSINYSKIGAPYYNVDFLGGFDILGNDQTINPDYYINFEPYNKKGFLWCNLYGKSMEPLITSGDKIVMHEIAASEIIYGEVYAIVTKNDMRTVKRVVRADDKKCVRLIPENNDPKFGDYQDIEIRNIRTIFKVDGAFKLF